MSKNRKDLSKEERAERETRAKTHKALGWTQVVLPGGKRRMFTAEGYKQWQANR